MKYRYCFHCCPNIQKPLVVISTQRKLYCVVLMERENLKLTKPKYLSTGTEENILTTKHFILNGQKSSLKNGGLFASAKPLGNLTIWRYVFVFFLWQTILQGLNFPVMVIKKIGNRPLSSTTSILE